MKEAEGRVRRKPIILILTLIRPLLPTPAYFGPKTAPTAVLCQIGAPLYQPKNIIYIYPVPRYKKRGLGPLWTVCAGLTLTST